MKIGKFNIKFDFKSIKFRLWIYFLMLSILILFILYFLQVSFLQQYYEVMKTHEVYAIGQDISRQSGKIDISKIQEYSYKNDLFIQIENTDGLLLYTVSDYLPHMAPNFYQKNISIAREKLLTSSKNHISFIAENDFNGMSILTYGQKIKGSGNSQMLLFIASSLSPVESTVNILRSQLLIVSFIALFLSFILSLYLSRRLSRPLIRIAKDAERLAEGQYGIEFQSTSYSEISRLSNALTYASKELKKNDQLQKDLVANVSHDLRTPLTMIKSYAEMIRDLSGDHPEKRNAHLGVIIEETDRLNTLVSDLLTLSKIQSGSIPIQKESYDLTESVRTILNSYTLMVEQEHYTIEFYTSGDTTVRADEQRIKQVVSNLVNNALRYSGDQKKVIVSLRETPDGVLCQVTDFGVGIPEDELKFVWDRYYRASTHGQRSATGGSGLGLAIVKEILLAHGARFGAESKLNEGSTFWFLLS